MQPKRLIINGVCYLTQDGNVVFIDFVTERSETYRGDIFKEFIKVNAVDENCILLANRDGGYVTPLFKYDLMHNKTKEPQKARLRSHDELIDLSFKVCASVLKTLAEEKTS